MYINANHLIKKNNNNEPLLYETSKYLRSHPINDPAYVHLSRFFDDHVNSCASRHGGYAPLRTCSHPACKY